MRRSISAILAAFMTASLLAACAGGDNEPTVQTIGDRGDSTTTTTEADPTTTSTTSTTTTTTEADNSDDTDDSTTTTTEPDEDEEADAGDTDDSDSDSGDDDDNSDDTDDSDSGSDDEFAGDADGLDPLVAATASEVDTSDAPSRNDWLTDWCHLARWVEEEEYEEEYADKFVADDGFRYKWDDVQTFCRRQSENDLDARAILVVNEDYSDAQARQMMTDQGARNAERLPVIRYDDFTNSRWEDEDKFVPVPDDRPQVRMVLLPVILRDDEFLGDPFEFVLADCANRGFAS